MKRINGSIKILDTIEVVLRDKDGNIKSKRTINNGFIHRLLCKLGLRHNSMTYAGFAELAGLMLTDIGGTAFDYIAIGEGTTAADPDDDTTYTHDCEDETARKTATGTRVTTDVNAPNDTAQLVATFSSGDGLSGIANITEIIVSNATAGNGTMLLRQVYSPADVCQWEQGDSLTITVKVQIKQGV